MWKASQEIRIVTKYAEMKRTAYSALLRDQWSLLWQNQNIDQPRNPYRIGPRTLKINTRFAFVNK